ncbi:MAG TPA: biotin--[acetyl-CoA-carboxylase] ligase [Chloroflexi bacterium]|nr:biotin--[acetyl-CoA-carboxylase] ligase [Chloroflexota bacterium]
MDRLNLAGLEVALTTQHLGHPLVFLPSTGSTNDVAKELAAQGAPEGTVVAADAQTTGRGRLGRRWSAPPGSSLLCSILFRPTLPLEQAPWLTMLCALALADAVKQTTGLQVALKWPNDVVVPSSTRTPSWRKLAGILTETEVTGEHLNIVIVGLGCNVNVAPHHLADLAPNATSLLAEIGQPVERGELLAALLARVEARYARLRAGASPHAEWASRLATLGHAVEATTATGSLTGVAEAVDEHGALLLRTPNGARHRLLSGDVTLARP